MKTSNTLSLLAALASTAVAYEPFNISYMYTKQPNGNPAGQTNYYVIEFNVSSTNGDTPQSAYCTKFWSDNYCYSGCVPYSTSVPTGEWLRCAHNETSFKSGKDNGDSEFAFQLYPGFSIGNFSVAIQQNFTSTSPSQSIQLDHVLAESAPYHITNTTSAYNCQMNPIEVMYEQHASGDCTTPSNSTGMMVPVASSSTTCQDGSNGSSTHVSFEVTKKTVWGANVLVSGNTTELGNWDPYKAVPLNAKRYNDTDFPHLWSGGDVFVPAGQAFEYKYIQWGLNGNLSWECGKNRIFTPGVAPACPYEVADEYTGHFRDGVAYACDCSCGTNFVE